MKQVLIVEDQRMPRENMERVISESDNYTLSASVNGADVALAICRRQRIDLILMDVCTSGNKDGIEAAADGGSRIFAAGKRGESRQLLV